MAWNTDNELEVALLDNTCRVLDSTELRCLVFHQAQMSVVLREGSLLAED